MNREPVVFVAHLDDRNAMKDLSAAKEFGTLREVFGRVDRNYDTASLIEHARRVLQDWRPNDSILMIGDPALCAICVAIAAEFAGDFYWVTTLSWDRVAYRYIPRHWDLNYESSEEDDDY